MVLLHDIAPFVQITAADIALEKLRTVPAGSLTRLDQAIGRTPWRALTAGSWLNDESFEGRRQAGADDSSRRARARRGRG